MNDTLTQSRLAMRHLEQSSAISSKSNFPMKTRRHLCIVIAEKAPHWPTGAWRGYFVGSQELKSLCDLML